jgi:hypothetical protein
MAASPIRIDDLNSNDDNQTDTILANDGTSWDDADFVDEFTAE